MIDVAFGPFEGKGSSEQGMLRTLLHNLNEGDVLLGDAFFSSYSLLWALQTIGVDCLCEQMGGRGRSTHFRKGKSLGPRGHLIESVPDEKVECELICEVGAFAHPLVSLHWFPDSSQRQQHSGSTLSIVISRFSASQQKLTHFIASAASRMTSRNSLIFPPE